MAKCPVCPLQFDILNIESKTRRRKPESGFAPFLLGGKKIRAKDAGVIEKSGERARKSRTLHRASSSLRKGKLPVEMTKPCFPYLGRRGS